MMAFDTETTGLIENLMTRADLQPEVIEFFGVAFDASNGEVQEELEILIKPAKLPLPEKIVNITGITDEMLAEAPSFSEVGHNIIDFIERQATVVAHNLSFDMDMLNLETSKMNTKIIWPPGLCTVEQTLHIKGFRLTLSDLHEHLFGNKFAGAHRARPDVEALMRCCCELFKRGEL